MLSSLQDKDQKTISILSQYFAQTLKQASNHDSKALTSSLQAILSSTISKEIENNQDKMVDALYPILGGMVSKYVTQAIKKLMEGINTQIEQGLSLKYYKRKAKALFTGVSEAQLMLEEASDAHILAMYVLQKDSALLIAQAQLEESTIGDPHMVASMASAIKDFINDWVSSSEESKEVQIMSYGNITLYIESAGSVYLIAFLDAEPDYEIREEINSFFASLVRRYSTFFQAFDGDDSAQEVEDISTEMSVYLNNQASLDTINIQQASSRKYGLWLIGIAIVTYMGWSGYKKFELYQIEQQILEQTGYAVKLKNKKDQIYLLGEVKTFEDDKKIRDIIEKSTNIEINNQLRMKLPDIYRIIHHQSDTIQNRITKLEAQMQRSQEKVIQKLHFKEFIIAKIDKLFEKQQGVVVRKDGSLDFSDLKLFNTGTVILNEQDKNTIKKVFKEYVGLLLGDEEIRPFIKQIILEGHTDSIGRAVTNKKLSLSRAQMVKEYILSLNLPKEYNLEHLLLTQGAGSQELIFTNGIENKEASRRIKIKFVLNKQLLLQNIGKIRQRDD